MYKRSIWGRQNGNPGQAHGKAGSLRTTVWTLRPLRIRVACIISYCALNVILAPQLQTHREDNHGNETYGSQPGPYA